MIVSGRYQIMSVVTDLCLFMYIICEIMSVLSGGMLLVKRWC